MDIGSILIFLFWLYILYSFLGKGRKKKRNESDMPAEEELPVPEEQLKVQESHNEKRTYDYDAFRERLRHSWGLPEDTETEKEDSISVESAASGSIQMEKPEEPRRERHAVVSQIRKSRNEQVSFMQAYLEKSAGRASEESSSQQQKRQAFPFETKKIVWTEKDVKQWAVYAAVFGDPRSRAPWKPVQYRPK